MDSAVEKLTRLNQHRRDGVRAPHKPLLVLMALGRLQRTGKSDISWVRDANELSTLIDEFGSGTSRGRSGAAYPFTRLRADDVWLLSEDVANDSVGELSSSEVVGRLTPEIERALLADPVRLASVAGRIVDAQFPATLRDDVLNAVGLAAAGLAPVLDPDTRKRDARFRQLIIEAWDRSCAFCEFDGRIDRAVVGVEAAHVRWFNFEGPDEADNGLALCSLHHKLFDRGVLGLRDPETVMVSRAYSANSSEGKRVYDLHDRRLRPRPGTQLPAPHHVNWHTDQVFRGDPLSA